MMKTEDVLTIDGIEYKLVKDYLISVANKLKPIPSIGAIREVLGSLYEITEILYDACSDSHLIKWEEFNS